MKSERGALVRGSDPPFGHTVFTIRPVIRGGRRPGVWYKNICPRVCRKQTTKFLDPSPMAKTRPSSGLGEERMTPRATPRLLDHGSTRYLRGRHLHSLALPDTKRVGHGLIILCRDRRSIVTKAVFDQRVHNFQLESTDMCSRVDNFQSESTESDRFRRVQPCDKKE